MLIQVSWWFHLIRELYANGFLGTPNSSIGITTRQRAGRPRNQGSAPGRGERILCSEPCPDRLWSSPTFYFMGASGGPPRVKLKEHEANYPFPSSAGFRSGGISYTCNPQKVFMASCLVKHRDNFIVRIPTTLLHAFFSHRLFSFFRPKKYYTISWSGSQTNNSEWRVVSTRLITTKSNAVNYHISNAVKLLTKTN
jgi:hypothetical protein